MCIYIYINTLIGLHYGYPYIYTYDCVYVYNYLHVYVECNSPLVLIRMHLQLGKVLKTQPWTSPAEEHRPALGWSIIDPNWGLCINVGKTIS